MCCCSIEYKSLGKGPQEAPHVAGAPSTSENGDASIDTATPGDKAALDQSHRQEGGNDQPSLAFFPADHAGYIAKVSGMHVAAVVSVAVLLLARRRQTKIYKKKGKSMMLVRSVISSCGRLTSPALILLSRPLPCPSLLPSFPPRLPKIDCIGPQMRGLVVQTAARCFGPLPHRTLLHVGLTCTTDVS